MYFLSSLNTLSIKQLLVACSESKMPNHSIQDLSCLSLIYLFSLLHLSNWLHNPHFCHQVKNVPLGGSHLYFHLYVFAYVAPIAWNTPRLSLPSPMVEFYSLFRAQLQCHLSWSPFLHPEWGLHTIWSPLFTYYSPMQSSTPPPRDCEHIECSGVRPT